MMDPKRREEIREMYELHPEVVELIAALYEAEKELAGRFQAFCPPEEAVALRRQSKLAREVVEAARSAQDVEGPCGDDCPEDCWSGNVAKAIERYDKGVK